MRHPRTCGCKGWADTDCGCLRLPGEERMLRETMKLHIFTKEGSTFTFLNVTDFVVNESVVTFSFMAPAISRAACSFNSSCR